MSPADRHLNRPWKTYRAAFMTMLISLSMLMPILNGTRMAYAELAYQSLESITGTVRRYVIEHYSADIDSMEVEVDRLDRRLRLSSCDKPIEAFFPNGLQRTGNTTVGVRCGDAKPWTLYVPVRIKVVKDVVVITQPLSRGKTLGVNDIHLAPHDISQLNAGYFTELSAVLGMELTRTMRGSMVVSPTSVKSPVIVKRGQRVTLIAQSNGIEVRMGGTALANGALGQRVRVKNLTSKRMVEGIVQANGIVQIQ